MTLQFRKLPCQSSGKCRLLTMPVPGHGRDGFQHNRSVAIALAEHGVREETQALGESQCDPVSHIVRGLIGL